MSAFDEFKEWVNDLDRKILTVNALPYLEDASQRFAELMYEQFPKSVVLSRVFATIPFGMLPDFRQNFVLKLSESAGLDLQTHYHLLFLRYGGVRKHLTDSQQVLFRAGN